MGSQIRGHLLLVEGDLSPFSFSYFGYKLVTFLNHNDNRPSTQMLQVKLDGSLISDLDLFHHRPYEYLLLGYCSGVVSLTVVTRITVIFNPLSIRKNSCKVLF